LNSGCLMKERIHIHIGEFHASSKPVVIHTVLGSCVSVCLIDTIRFSGGMNHILMPGQTDLFNLKESARYGINAMELLLDSLTGLGSDRKRLVAKVFGGAHVISSISKENGVGLKNISFVLDFLEKEKIPITSMDVGGSDSRKIFFHTDSGNVFLKRIPSLLMTNADND